MIMMIGFKDNYLNDINFVILMTDLLILTPNPSLNLHGPKFMGIFNRWPEFWCCWLDFSTRRKDAKTFYYE